MNKTSRQLLLASALTAGSLGVGAQPLSVMPSTPTAPETQTQAQRDYEAAKAACQAQRSKSIKAECLRNAEDDYNHGTGGTASGIGAGGGGGQEYRNQAEVLTSHRSVPVIELGLVAEPNCELIALQRRLYDQARNSPEARAKHKR